VFAYLVKRLLATIPVMGVVALFVFSLLYISPGDPAAVIAGDIATDEDIARIAQLGLDQPYLVRFGTWLWALAHGDLGSRSSPTSRCRSSSGSGSSRPPRSRSAP
jgi:peptide/nickel transport system permease protein